MEQPTIIIRRGRPADAAGIARVHVDSWRTSYQGIVPADFLAGLSYERRQQRWDDILTRTDRRAPHAQRGTSSGAWWDDIQARTDGGGVVYVAEDEAGQIVGFAAGGPERNGDPVYRGEVYAIYLLAGQQRRGAGRRLMGAVAADLAAAGLHSLLLWVLAENAPARRFYAALGGVPLREQTFELGGVPVVEVAYGWADTAGLIGEPEAGVSTGGTA